MNKAVTKDEGGWHQSRVGRFYEVTLGKMLQPTPKNIDDVYVNYMCAANIKWDGIKLSPLKQMWFTQTELSQYLINIGDLLVTEGGDVGVSSIWNGELDVCYIQNSVHLVKSNINSTKFLYYWLFNLKSTGWIDNACNKATIAHFTKEKLENAPLLLPTFLEQQKIVTYLDEKCACIDTLIGKITDEISLLHEYCTRMISDVVTGKMDMRGVTVPKYETEEETAMENDIGGDEVTVEAD